MYVCKASAQGQCAKYSQTCLFQTPWEPTKTVLIKEVSILHRSIYIAMGPQLTVLIVEVSLFHRFIYTHLYCNGTTTDCPYYRSVLISECSGLTVVSQTFV